MAQDGFRKLYWGFLFAMIDFRIQGIDVFPDVLGYLLFALGLAVLGPRSTRFRQAGQFNVAMIILSLFSLYERPIQDGGAYLGPLGPLGMLIGFAAMVVDLLVVYHLFMGVADLASRQGAGAVAGEAGIRWRQYVLLAVAVLLGQVLVFLPALGIVYVVGLLMAAVALTVAIMGFMARCGERLQGA
jgi:hypothetical protein